MLNISDKETILSSLKKNRDHALKMEKKKAHNS